MEQTNTKTVDFVSSEDFLNHLLGHRSLTRRVIEVFPEKEFFEFSIGGMRSFAEQTMELLGIAGPGFKEIVTGHTEELNEQVDHGNSKEKMLQLWDEATEEVTHYFRRITPERFSEEVLLFGKYKGTVWSSILYFTDNEIHHRGQGYVYLRALGIEPPFFWDR